jgi:hypothetical protein
MELEKQVCSLELAKKLKKLGVKQASTWYWFKSHLVLGDDQGHNMRTLSSAFTAIELLALLPYCIEIPNMTVASFLGLGKTYDGTFCIYYAVGTHHKLTWSWHENIANAAATALIYLIENKLVTL